MGTALLAARVGLTEAELIAAARMDFWCFIELVFPVLHPGQMLDYADYLGLMASLMMAVESGDYRRVIFNLPPRHMKSQIISVLFVAWQLGRNPSAKVITISYGDDLAHDHSGLTRTLMLSPLYRRIFPGTILDKLAVSYVRTTMGGYRYATSIGSDITGFGADLIIIDDPMQPSEAGSEQRKEFIRNWVFNSVLTRFNDPAKGALVLVMHRLAPDDLSATLAPQADFILKLPLIAQAGEGAYAVNDKVVMHRRPGESLNPARISQAQAEELKATLPRHVWESQYQQHPTAGGSGMLSIERFRRYDLKESPDFELLIHSWDIGATISGNASVCTKWGLLTEPNGRPALYLTDVILLKLELPEVRAAIRSQDKIDRPALIILDERGAGMGLYQELLREGYRNIVASTATEEPIDRDGESGKRPSASKIERFGRATLLIADGQVVIPNTAPWLERFLYEVAAFPNIADKDQVDSMSQVIGNFEISVMRARMNAERHLR